MSSSIVGELHRISTEKKQIYFLEHKRQDVKRLSRGSQNKLTQAAFLGSQFGNADFFMEKYLNCFYAVWSSWKKSCRLSLVICNVYFDVLNSNTKTSKF